MRQHQGVMPREVADLKSIPGVGAYAAGMIAPPVAYDAIVVFGLLLGFPV